MYALVTKMYFCDSHKETYSSYRNLRFRISKVRHNVSEIKYMRDTGCVHRYCIENG